ncbi:amidohydrolase family protein [Kordiimonas marina]|uniref:amidohydrolase family protein n=1 Tax=Kordiimonas marina TaxID=2872312 RepID=UPI001FF4F586|nr:amidohydrolase family protein [Kordiimonas marina]MCJ9429993.1 amidohydrolase family protein [Kordiimonas marina]
MIIKSVFAGLLLTMSSLGAHAAEPQVGPATVYTHVALIDGTGAPMKTDMAILIEGDRIAKILPSAQMTAALPEGTKLVDGHGLYALPGLIDSHVHLTPVKKLSEAHARLRRYLYSGITSVRDMAGDARTLAELKRESLLKEIPSPNIYYAALMAGPMFFKDPRPGATAEGLVAGQVPWMQAITPKTDMTEAVALARGTGATGIKIYADLESKEVHRITAEAHRQGIKVWAHSMVFPATPADDVDAGVDVLSHVCRLAWQIAPVRPREYHHKVHMPTDRLDPADARLKALYAQMKARGEILDATLWLYTHLTELRHGQPETGAAQCSPKFAAALTRTVYDAGVDISTGTDSTLPASAAYPSLYDELHVLAHDVGMPPLQVIRSATYVGARALGLEGERGTLVPGKRADIVFVSKNPLEEIDNLRSVVLTVKDGTAYARKDYVPITNAELGDN